MAHTNESDLHSKLTDAARQVSVGGIYAHYRNPERTYTVLSLSLCEETMEPVVVYRANYGNRLVWTRPLSDWLGQVHVNGSPAPRFQRVDGEETRPLLVVVTGHPATGKTTLARRLAVKLCLPLVSKDDLKEGMAEAIEALDREASRKIGRAAYFAMDRVIESCMQGGSSLIVESNFPADFYTEKLRKLLEKYPYRAVQVLCKANPEVILERVQKRISSGERHQAHREQEDLDSGAYRKGIGNGRIAPLGITGTMLELDTTDFSEVDTDAVIREIRNLL